MPILPKQPLIYEINTWVWLAELSCKHKSPMTLATVPAEEWDAIASFGFDAVWLMGLNEARPARGSPGSLSTCLRNIEKPFPTSPWRTSR